MRSRLTSGCIISAVLVGLLACSPSPETASTSGQPVVYGEDSRQEAWEHPDPVLRARAVESTIALIRPSRIDDSDPNDVRIVHETLAVNEELCLGERFRDQQVGASCSGTLVDWDLVLTAGHCVDNLSICQNRWFVFDHLYEAEGRLANISMQDVFQCRRIIARRDSGGVDYALVQLDRPVGPPRRPAPVYLGTAPLTEGSSVAVVGFPDGIPAKLDDEGVVLIDGAPEFEEFEATLDTFGGNSGSGVYDRSHTVVGILSRGETDYVRNGACYVVNRLPPEGDMGDAEGVSYVRTAVEGLCDAGWRGALCGEPDGPCRPCATDAVCPEGWACRAAAADPAISWCAAPCTVDADCAAGHACVNSACDPVQDTICEGRAVYNRNACGRVVDEVETCPGPFEVCRDGACRTADPANSCADPETLAAVDQVVTSSIGPGLSNEHSGSCGGNGAERVYALEISEPTRLVATAEGFDTVLYLRSTCDRPPTERACSDDDDPPGGRGSQIDLTLSPGRFFLFMDAFGRTTGDYVLTLDFTSLAPADAGLPPDTGVPPDSGVPPDAGMTPDAGVAPVDAGPAPVDAGPLTEPDKGGCGCRAEDGAHGSAASGGVMLGVFGLWRRRRRRRAT